MRFESFRRPACLVGLVLLSFFSGAQDRIPVGEGWARNSVNTVVFRKNSLASYGNTQFIAYYNADGFVVVGKRAISSRQWQVAQTPFKGNVADAHNTISIAVDGEGYLHLAWDHHNTKLRYARSVQPASLTLTEELPMTGQLETRVSYPEFYHLPNGDLLFFFRDGASGAGNLVINRYQVRTKTWTQLHRNVINGEKARNAYWQACVDANGTLHISWVWRESPDVASNHDLCYARSKDGGLSWEKSTGESYTLPITATTAEYAMRIPQNHDLINQTSMTTDGAGNPYIASYWRDSGTTAPQYQVVYKQGPVWKKQNLSFRKTSFRLSGGGTKRIPISRPQLVVWTEKKKPAAALIFRDEERGSKVSLAQTKNLGQNRWTLSDLTNEGVGSWEPSFDTELWKRKKQLHLFVQKTDQGDAEGLSSLAPQMVSVLQWQPTKKPKK